MSNQEKLEMVRRLALMEKEERNALKRRVLALFRRAEMVAIDGKLEPEKTKVNNNLARQHL